MPQVFGSGEIELTKVSAFFVEADYLDDVQAHENALSGAGFDSDSIPVNLDRTGHNPRGQIWGKHLMSDNTHHRYAIVRVSNPEVNPNDKEAAVGGVRRYAAEIHTVPRYPAGSQKNPSGRIKGSVTPIWQGNDITKFIGGVRRGPEDVGRTWPDIQKAMQRGTRG
ncbi:MAG TPA: hypothetical protein VIY48_01690 [Candidatus Paceibacterota bacterium]